MDNSTTNLPFATTSPTDWSIDPTTENTTSAEVVPSSPLTTNQLPQIPSQAPSKTAPQGESKSPNLPKPEIPLPGTIFNDIMLYLIIATATAYTLLDIRKRFSEMRYKDVSVMGRDMLKLNVAKDSETKVVFEYFILTVNINFPQMICLAIACSCACMRNSEDSMKYLFAANVWLKF